MMGDTKKGRYLYYVHKCPDAGKQVSIPESKIAEYFDSEMKRISMSEEFYSDLKEIFKSVLQEKESSSDHEKKVIFSKLANLNIKKQRFYDLFGEGGIDAAELRDQIDRINLHIKSLEDSKSKLVENTDSLILRISRILENIRNMPKIYISSQDEKKSRHSQRGD